MTALERAVRASVVRRRGWITRGRPLLALTWVLAVHACQREVRTASSASSAPSAAASDPPAPEEREVEIIVEGMHCATCPVTVRTAAENLAGVIDVRVSMAEGRAWVRYRPSETAPAFVAAAITDSGYPAHDARR
ncbi:MAG: heavy-metal-associated domain-containing protein [Myxococcales bacterium]|nr:heavy-metal-associated domain-containing protein [Myxococcales bacterium]